MKIPIINRKALMNMAQNEKYQSLKTKTRTSPLFTQMAKPSLRMKLARATPTTPKAVEASSMKYESLAADCLILNKEVFIL